MNKNILISALLATMLLAQLIIPFKMIYDKEQVIRQGTAYKFIVTPVDPNDPMRGKYIDLNFEANHLWMQKALPLQYDEDVYVSLKNDSRGYATISDLSTKAPTHGDYIIAKMNYQNNYSEDSAMVVINYPFNKYYMEESKASEAEKIYRETLTDSSKTIYGIVYVRKGDAVLKDVCINNVSIKDLAKRK